MATPITVHCRIAYPALFAPKQFQGETSAKYRCTLVIPENDPQLVQIRAIEQALIQQELDGVIPAGNNILLKTDPSNTAMAGHVTIGAKSGQQPDIVGMDRQQLLDPLKITDGCWCYVNIGIFAYTTPNKGISAFLNTVVFERPGEGKLGKGGGPSIDDVFAQIPGAPPAAGGPPSVF